MDGLVFGWFGPDDAWGEVVGDVAGWVVDGAAEAVECVLGNVVAEVFPVDAGVALGVAAVVGAGFGLDVVVPGPVLVEVVLGPDVTVEAALGPDVTVEAALGPDVTVEAALGPDVTVEAVFGPDVTAVLGPVTGADAETGA